MNGIEAATLEDEYGQPSGVHLPYEETIIRPDPSNVGKAVKVGNDEFTIVWDGGKPDPMLGGHTKGRLLPVGGPPYIDSLTALMRLYGKPESDDEKSTDAIIYGTD